MAPDLVPPNNFPNTLANCAIRQYARGMTTSPESRRAEFFGSVQYGTDLTCGYDGGYEDRDLCGMTATVHVWPGSPPDQPDEHTCWACEEHAAILYGRAWDWHAVGGACGMPDARWHNGVSQGVGLCRHDLDEETMTVALIAAGERAVTTNAHPRGVV